MACVTPDMRLPGPAVGRTGQVVLRYYRPAVWAKRFGVPAGTPLITFGDAEDWIQAFSVALATSPCELL
jgi:hypothetical protein